ncbi:uncharacterized protein OCT59_019104 [Rhizophagus irregularis]|uniref:uncharacterized protein n=1 Tax=Rhizophagus irregularis TaxID=588596 RepID=UPI001A085019|nr:hypothetical protein OCT59_000271 [Rhizophagus irregularis]UZO26892.1 hypothetical protein OCT59_019104 [Rhizophagus irregularis]GET62498.1 hypothetical protein GLOIN_2v1779779 [Rhizophagus irregularis DAOM 181602=DAOM 197198]
MINLHAATSLAEDLGLDLVDIYGIRKWIQIRASPLNDPDIVAEMVRNLPVKEFGKHLKINRLWFAGMVVIERALLRCGFITQESDWEKWTQITYNIQLLKEGHTPDDSDDESDDGEVSLDDSDDEEYF